MWPLAAASILGSGLSFAGGLMGNAQNAQTASMQMAAQQQQFFEQMDFAKQQFNTGGFVDIQNRINAAKAFGVSPLAALGVPSVSLPGIPAGDISGGGGNATNPLAGFSNLGQDLARAASATSTAEEKALRVAQTALATKQLDRSDAEINELNARANYYNSAAARTPSFPSPVADSGNVVPGQGNSGVHVSRVIAGGGDAGGYVPKPPEVTTASPGSPGTASGRAVPSSEFSWTDPMFGNTPRLFRQPAAGTPAAQGDIFGSAENWIRNRIMPNFDRGGPRDPSIMAAIRDKYPDAVSYEHTGYGYYRPVFPDEDVRRDVRLERLRR